MSADVAVVTGGARGIGAAIAERLVADGYQVVIADLDLDACTATATSLGNSAVPLRLDVRDPDSVHASVAYATGLGPIKAVINNAGITRTGPTADLPLSDWDAVIQTNLSGCFLVSQAFAPAMFGLGRSSFVNIGSLYSTVSAPGRAAYTAAKHGIIGLTRSLALEWARQGIRVNAVLPGWLDTEMFRSQVDAGRVDLDYLIARIPLGALGNLTEVADVVAFLCSDDARYVTGQALAVDGGYLANGTPAPFAS